ncbi:MAG: aminotransferase DegT [Sphingomonas bacterium]|uniref:DegT/DnrJ/EryC1/StrS family aminotransferase n=1 Tax=Sphingomonas bacterium TaxID=1895847 RepID=UPI00261D5B54|nr:DegT/DnrJ/EryC1/StrS family aminotransferase [Sphingomonas bacterium]MDB5708674.1 aminotransferase DegT [Sphingomonas bacterium]
MRHLPLIAPNPPRLSALGEDLRRVEASGIFSNNGPEVRAFETEATGQLFGGQGASLAVANATLGLMIALKEAAGARPKPGALALMPALTFAATAQAAHWAGLTPLICDVNPDDWSMAAHEEERLIARYGERLAVLLPYATFGNAIDLDRYAWLKRRQGIGVVVDAAASLGTIDARGRGFGAGAPFATVFSMHATKPFAVAEGGLIHSGDTALIDRLRAMACFGFEAQRSATLPGLNAKLPEVIAVMARAKLDGFDAACDHRAGIEQAYRDTLSGVDVQAVSGRRRASQFMTVALPRRLTPRRDAIAAALEAQGIGTGRYFSPHLGEQPWVQSVALIERTPVADALAARLLSLPLTDAMTPDDAVHVSRTLADICRAERGVVPATVGTPVAETLLVGGGPAGTAMLTAASKRGVLPELARGLVMVERDASVGGGRLGGYAITSDSTAQTFLSAVAGNPHPEVAALEHHPVGRTVVGYADALGVPLVEAGPLLRQTGERLARIVVQHGGTVLTGHEALGTRQTAEGLWATTLRRADGQTFERLSRNVVIATGGHQPFARLAEQQVAGRPLGEQAGERLRTSDEVLALGGVERIAATLADTRAPRIVVIGGSTSALATVALLLRSRPGIAFGAGGVTLLHRRPLRPFYPSVESAHAEGFTDFGPDDVCPVSGFVYRLAGFRLEARELVLRMLGIDGRAPDPRVALRQIGDDDAGARDLISGADVVIGALGYRPHALPVSDRSGTPIALAAEAGTAMVDRHCRVMDAAGTPLPGLFGIGLAAGFVPWGAMGGEPSFRGQANGLWQWQNDVGMMIVEQLLGGTRAAVAA